mmetsp:Transcript_53253/g.137753  ORF Transcript_53253/g.137753 Transcript_53253/m.137753 type:complete len:124 (-) Transcript_53253:568-939(-)
MCPCRRLLDVAPPRDGASVSPSAGVPLLVLLVWGWRKPGKRKEKRDVHVASKCIEFAVNDHVTQLFSCPSPAPAAIVTLSDFHALQNQLLVTKKVICDSREHEGERTAALARSRTSYDVVELV